MRSAAAAEAAPRHRSDFRVSRDLEHRRYAVAAKPEFPILQFVIGAKLAATLVFYGCLESINTNRIRHISVP